MQNKELRTLVSEVKNGTRTVILPPGAILFAFSIVASLISTVFFSGSLIQLFTLELNVGTRATLQFMSMGVIFLGCILPGLMITRGKKLFSTWLRGYFFILGSTVALTLLFGAITGNTAQNTPLLISLFFVLFSITASLQARFKLFCEFYYILKN